MAEEPQIIRERIERTRGEMDDTLDALAEKTDVKSQVKGWVADKKDAVVGVARDAKSSVAGTAPDTDDVKESARRGATWVKENPIGLAIGAAAVGFVAGLFLPSTAKEDEALGPMADRVKDTAKELGGEALERGKEIGQEAAGAAVDSATQAAGEQAEELKESAKEKTQQFKAG